MRRELMNNDTTQQHTTNNTIYQIGLPSIWSLQGSGGIIEGIDLLQTDREIKKKSKIILVNQVMWINFDAVNAIEILSTRPLLSNT
jgi:hypothetical protein